MTSFKDYLQCENIKTIKDINDQYTYEDKTPNGKRDHSLVSCGQEGSYNELKYIYENILKRYCDLGAFTKDEALEAMCETCSELESPRSREKFYEVLSNKLDIAID